jgi:hypothetical protein
MIVYAVSMRRSMRRIVIMTKVKAYCNMCGFDTYRDEGEDCPYHQKVLSDGTLLYDEFNQDGEEL